MQQLRAPLKASIPADTPLDIDWVGTSMGGLIGLGFSTLPPEVTGVRIRKMVLNDVGPRLRHDALLRIGDYLGQPKRFADEQEAAAYLWSISTGFGPHTPEQWLALSRPLLRPAPDGQGLILHYDPAIAEPFKTISADAATSGEAALWGVYDGLKCEVLLLRGKNSDLLDVETALSMTQRGPKARLVEFEGVGHAPTLMAANQVDTIKDFLLA
jgi:pimeloyl-ACP methyl ester carboxylesterase